MDSPTERYEWAVGCLKDAQLRLTRPRQCILRALANQKAPVSLERLADDLEEACDVATIYRTMHRLRQAGIVRQVNLAAHCACFTLIAPGERCDYLVCRDCGVITDLPDAEPILELEKQVAARSGFRALEHETEFYGICPDCQRNTNPLRHR